MDDNKITCMYFSKRFNEKPQGKTCGWVQKNLVQTYIEMKDLAEALCHGASFKPGVLKDGNKASNWAQQQLFGLDFDDGVRIDEAYKRVVNLGIIPCFLYTTFSHREDYHKFRMIFCNDTVITDGIVRDKLQATLMGVVDGVDDICFNRDRLFFGGNGGNVLFPSYDSRINTEFVIGKYWKDEYKQYIPNKNFNSKSNGIINNKTEVKDIVFRDNTDAICSLNIDLLRERLGYCNTDIIQFQNENEMYQYINSIDLYEYLGVPQGTFNCILPKHKDNNPSASIYTTDDGTQIYKCFGCKQARTIISITEQLAHCRRSEAINFIKKVYGIDYKPSEWVEQQRQLMIDSAIYLDSDEFKETFPKINKLIRTRKGDIQKILMHMTKYVSDGLQYEDKPLFFASLPNLMKICERSNKNIMSQSVTLFALLNMLNKVELNCIPENELKKAKSISAKYGFKKIVNFYQIEEYGFVSLENSEKIAATLIENNVSLKGLSREYILRTFGVELADKVFPQYKYENRQPLSEKSEYLTSEIASMVLNTIKNQGYIFEKDINIKGTIGNQWKKSIQEILDIYGLKRVRLNNELKKKLNIKISGYPNIIIESC